MAVLLLKRLEKTLFDGNLWGDEEAEAIFKAGSYDFKIRVKGGLFGLANNGVFVLDVPQFLNYQTGSKQLDLQLSEKVIIEYIEFNIEKNNSAYLSYSFITEENAYSTYIQNIVINEREINLVRNIVNGLNLLVKTNQW